MAVLPVYETVPGTAVAPWFTVIDMLRGSIGSLKVTLTFLFNGTPVAPFAGSVEVSVGAVVSTP